MRALDMAFGTRLQRPYLKPTECMDTGSVGAAQAAVLLYLTTKCLKIHNIHDRKHCVCITKTNQLTLLFEIVHCLNENPPCVCTLLFLFAEVCAARVRISIFWKRCTAQCRTSLFPRKLFKARRFGSVAVFCPVTFSNARLASCYICSPTR